MQKNVVFLLSKCLVFCERPSFGLQKTVFYLPKDRLLQGETWSLRLETYLFQMRDERREMMVFPQIADIHTVGKKCEK